MFKGPRHTEAIEALSLIRQFSLDFLVLGFRSSAVDAVRSINPEERRFFSPGRHHRWLARSGYGRTRIKIGNDEMKIHHAGIEYRVHNGA